MAYDKISSSCSPTLHVGCPNIGDKGQFIAYVNDILTSCRLTGHGPMAGELEERLCHFLGVKHCILTCNGTIALELAMRALDLSGEVILPSFTFIATAHAVQWLGLRPVFCDIDPLTLNIDPNEIERYITPNTTAILGVHLYGRPCVIDALQAIADRHGLRLLFDAAHAFGCSYQGHMVGNFGACEVFSFNATKVFNTLEGGAITTNDDRLAEKLRLMRNFGFQGYDNVISLGMNGKMDEVSAAMGLVNLDSLDDFLQCNKNNYDHYRCAFDDIPGLTMLTVDESERHNWQYIVVEVGDDYPLDRDQLVAKLHRENILVRRYFYPGCHEMEPYRTLYPQSRECLTVTREKAGRVIVFPTGTAVHPNDIDKIVGLCRVDRQDASGIWDIKRDPSARITTDDCRKILVYGSGDNLMVRE